MSTAHAPSAAPEPESSFVRGRGISWPALVSALPDFGLAALYLSTWIAPDPARPTLVGRLMLAMLLEFIVVHSAAFMGTASLAPGTPAARALRIGGIGLFYTLFVGGFSLAFHQLWPLWSFWALIFNRMLSVLLKQPAAGEEQQFVKSQWAAGAAFYLVAVLLTTVLPLPRLGVTPQAIAAMHLAGRGLWVDQPWRVLAAGTFYFAATALSELFDHRLFAPTVSAPALRAR
jgi:hypothetical protein